MAGSEILLTDVDVATLSSTHTFNRFETGRRTSRLNGRSHLVIRLARIVIASLWKTACWWVSSGHGGGSNRKKMQCLVVRSMRRSIRLESAPQVIGGAVEWESVRHHFKSPSVPGELHHVQIAHPADAGCHTFESVTTPPQDPSPSTGCTVVATRIKWEATPTTVQSPRERKVKTTQKEDAEHVWLHLCDSACWASGEHQSCTRASL